MLNRSQPVGDVSRGYREIQIDRRSPDACLRRDTLSIADEVAIEIHLNQQSVVVTMASPLDVADLAVGFLVSEQYLRRDAVIDSIECFEKTAGVIVNVRAGATNELNVRARSVPARASCGLCGITSLDDAVARMPRVQSSPLPEAHAIHKAIATLRDYQALNAMTHAVHAAAWCTRDGDITLIREDIGRHNALDKLLGAKVSTSPMPAGFVIATSRVSYELVLKAAAHGVTTLVAVSAPTTLSVDIADALGVNLIAIARDDNHSVFVQQQARSYVE